MNLLQKIENFIFETPKWKFICWTFFLLFLKVGIITAHTPFSSQYTLVQNPFKITLTSDDYLLSSWLGPFLAWLTGFSKSRELFFLFSYSFSIGFFFLMIRLIFLQLPDSLARISFVLFAILPVSSIAYWTIIYDTLTLFLIALALNFAQFLLIAFLIGIALGMQHFELTFFAFGAPLIFFLLVGKEFQKSSLQKPLFYLSVLVGSILGRLIVVFIIKLYNISAEKDVFFLTRENFLQLEISNFYALQIVLWTSFGLGWVIALKYLEESKTKFPFFCVLLGLMMSLVFLVQDVTRVPAIASLPLVTACWLTRPSFLQNFERKEISYLFLIWIFLPFMWVLTAEKKIGINIFLSAFSYDLTYIVAWPLRYLKIPIHIIDIVD